ncbi:FCS-Like Zinc finger 6-like [Ipomoea triloba]|uniref:FCS-Like Zinc finger 6-like n=1 Tax=Ipomoea triloba TaxID=35885 RepID=UPI00125D2A7D|nr:FCS-Like Zinc finger 6-like [Ipomoea triloba]
MLLGKRARQSINRTTSMSEFALDLGIEEASMAASANDFEPFDPRNAFKAGGLLRPPASDAVTARTLNRRRSADFTETAHFLRACYLCKRCLIPNRDIYMYRGDSAFCSLECRQQHMAQDERKEKYLQMTSNKKETATTSSSAGAGAAESEATAV